MNRSDNEKKRDLVESMKHYSIELKQASPKERLKFLEATGMYTKTGKLKRCYR